MTKNPKMGVVGVTRSTSLNFWKFLIISMSACGLKQFKLQHRDIVAMQD